jgi:hypothetical protein
MPKWLQGFVLFTCGINIMTGIVLFWIFLTINYSKPTPFTNQERVELIDNFPRGKFIDAGTYRVCINGIENFFYANGRSGSFNAGCWQ